MRQFQFSPGSPQIIARPTCPCCGDKMLLAGIAPKAPGIDQRTFECPTCAHAEDVVVAIGAQRPQPGRSQAVWRSLVPSKLKPKTRSVAPPAKIEGVGGPNRQVDLSSGSGNG